jgi:hypothetical protein
VNGAPATSNESDCAWRQERWSHAYRLSVFVADAEASIAVTCVADPRHDTLPRGSRSQLAGRLGAWRSGVST